MESREVVRLYIHDVRSDQFARLGLQRLIHVAIRAPIEHDQFRLARHHGVYIKQQRIDFWTITYSRSGFAKRLLRLDDDRAKHSIGDVLDYVVVPRPCDAQRSHTQCQNRRQAPLPGTARWRIPTAQQPALCSSACARI
jgi:hypothetical protein